MCPVPRPPHVPTALLYTPHVPRGGGMVTSSRHIGCVCPGHALASRRRLLNCPVLQAPNKRRTQIAIAPRGSGVPGMSAPGAGGRLLSSQCAIAPRGMIVRETRASRRSEPGERGGESHPVTSSQGLCVLTSDPPWQCSRLGCSSQSLRCRCQ